jgi:hypothetical protein
VTGRSLLAVFPTLQDLANVSPEDLGAVIVELAPGMMQNGMFNIDSLTGQLYQQVGPSYARGTQRQASNIPAEALSWLTSQGLLLVDPEQPDDLVSPYAASFISPDSSRRRRVRQRAHHSG